MIVQQIAELAHVPVRAVIINCDTRWVTTLALLSALRYAHVPILLIDCESTDGSWEWFCELAAKHSFAENTVNVVKMPLRPHGKTLDRLFQEIRADKVLLVDSDLEILSPTIVADSIRAASENGIYGAGFLHAGEWIRGGHLPASAHGYYMERMWIPFTCLNVAPIRSALAAGNSFMHSRDYFEFPHSLLLSKALYARHRLPLLKKLELKFLHRFRQQPLEDPMPNLASDFSSKVAPLPSSGVVLRPAFCEYDTGARLHAYMRQTLRSEFGDFGMGLCAASVKHYHGITRATLSPGRDNATPPNSVLDEVMQRLSDEYGVNT